MFDVLTDETRTARKAHRCIWCGQDIKPGDTYRYQSGVFEGGMQSNHWHPECIVRAREDLPYIEDGFDPYVNERGDEPKGERDD